MVITGILFISSFFTGYSQPVHQHRSLKWFPINKVEIGPGDSMQVLSFKGAASQLEAHGFLPVFLEMFPLNSPDDQLISLSIENPVYQEISKGELSGVKDLDQIPTSIIPENSIATQRNNAFLSISFVPIRKNTEKGTFEKLLFFDLVYEIRENSEVSLKKTTRVYAAHSILSIGTWFKMSIPLSGIYIIQAKDLKNIDPAFSTIDPRTIQIFGNDGGMLPESNATPRIDDLRELSIQVVGTDPTKLNDNDYIIFYAKGPDTWQYNKTNQLFHHTKNLYSNYSYCFLTYGQAFWKRVVAEPSVTDTPNPTINRFRLFFLRTS